MLEKFKILTVWGVIPHLN